MEHAATAAPGWLGWLQDGAIGQTIRQSPTLYPVVEILHILGFALLVGAIVALDARLLGSARFLPADGLTRLLRPIAIGGFLLAAPTGALLFTTDAVTIAGNPMFLAKLALIGLAVVNLALFHLGPWRSVAAWKLQQPPLAARLSAGLSIALWIAVIVCGRLIAYY